MKIKLLSVVALSLLSGVAFATDSDSTTAVNKFTMPSFEDMDGDHDGMMSKAEYDAGMAKMGHGMMGGDAMGKDSMGSDAMMGKDSMSGGAMGKDSMAHGSMGK